MKTDTQPGSVRVFISYSHDSAPHKANILALAQELRAGGIEAMVDRFVENEPPLSWPLWMHGQIEESDAVLLVFTETYSRRFLNREVAGEGLGAKWEGAIVTSNLYHSQDETSKFIPLVIDAGDVKHVPAPLSLTTFYVIGTEARRGEDSTVLEPLLRRLLGQPAVIPGPVGEPAALMGTRLGKLDRRTRVDQAMSNEDTDEKVRALQGLLNDQNQEVRGLAAFNLGVTWQSEGRFAEAINAYQRAIELLASGSEAAEASAANLRNVLESMNSHYGPGSAVDAARHWLRAIRDDEITTAWCGIAPQARLALAQAWILANQGHPTLAGYDDRDNLARRLAQAIPDHPLSSAFLATQLSEFERAYQAFDEETWGAAERPRRFGIDIELVIFLPTGGGPMTWQPGTQLPAIQITLQRIIGTWYVAGFSDSLLIPGWPPSQTALDAP